MDLDLDLDYYLNNINLSDIECIEESRKNTSMDIYETEILLSSIDDYQKNIEKLEYENDNLKNKINVLEMKLSYYQHKNDCLVYEKKNFIKKTKPNMLKRIWFFIRGKKYIIVE